MIDRKGNMTVTYDGMIAETAVLNTPHGSSATDDVWSGTQHGRVTLPAAKATSGPWQTSAGHDTMQVTGTMTAPVYSTGTGPLDGYLAQGVSPGLLSPLTPGTFTYSAGHLGLTLAWKNAIGTWQLVPAST